MTFKFGSKVAFKDQEQIHPDLRNKHFALLGFCDNAFALIEWHKRGSYNIDFYSGNPDKNLLLIEDTARLLDGVEHNGAPA